MRNSVPQILVFFKVLLFFPRLFSTATETQVSCNMNNHDLLHLIVNWLALLDKETRLCTVTR